MSILCYQFMVNKDVYKYVNNIADASFDVCKHCLID